ncbi:MAG TPA: FG-GAP-like repeat-containing protein [Spirochaetota bacterium]|nr:FG-GAP-like repeat-containing protein [Spirochaetota bacterium]
MRNLQIISLFVIIVFQAGCFNAFSSNDSKDKNLLTALIVAAGGLIPGGDEGTPSVSVTSIKNNGVLKSGFIFGSASNSGTATITTVEVSLDGGAYQAATGTTVWNYQMPTGVNIWKDGTEHTINVRSVNSASAYSDVTTLTVRKGVNCDVNGDGYQDMAVGAPRYNSKQGRVYIYHGSPAGTGTSSSKTLTGENTADQFGVSLVLGDINGDGYSDCVVGASGYNSKTGRIYVYFGSTDGINSTSSPPSQARDGATSAENFGGPLDIGDVNGDGYEDLAVGAPQYNTNWGRAYIYHGASSGISASANQTLTGASGSHFGGKLVIGDTNGDGYGELAVSAPTTTNGNVYMFNGSGTGIGSTASKTLTGENSGDSFGFSLTLGDINGDGYGDLVASSPFYSSGTGRLYIFNGSSTGIDDVSTPLHIDAEAAGIYLGSSMTLGDVNRDGYLDLVYDAPGFTSGTFTMAGRVYVHHGTGTGLNVTASQTLTGGATNMWFGFSVALGDINGDGYDDLAAGTPYPDTNTGIVNLFHGSSTGIASSSSRTLTGEGTNNGFGYSVSLGNIESDDWNSINF